VSETSSQPQLTQPAYTNAFMSAIASSVTGVNVGNYPQPTGYHVYVTSPTGVVDNTTNVYTYSINDQYQEQSEVTSVTFIAVYVLREQLDYVVYIIPGCECTYRVLLYQCHASQDTQRTTCRII